MPIHAELQVRMLLHKLINLIDHSHRLGFQSGFPRIKPDPVGYYLAILHHPVVILHSPFSYANIFHIKEAIIFGMICIERDTFGIEIDTGYVDEPGLVHIGLELSIGISYGNMHPPSLG